MYMYMYTYTVYRLSHTPPTQCTDCLLLGTSTIDLNKFQLSQQHSYPTYIRSPKYVQHKLTTHNNTPTADRHSVKINKLPLMEILDISHRDSSNWCNNTTITILATSNNGSAEAGKEHKHTCI